MSSRRYNRRSTRPLEDLPGLFDDEETSGFSVGDTRPHPQAAAAASDGDDMLLDERYAVAPRRLRFISFGSGSSGNCSYIGTQSEGVLIDAGVDNNYVTAELLRNGIDIAHIRGIFLTHDHADHVRFAYALLRRNPHLRLYATPRTLEGLLRRHNISRRIKDYHAPIYKEHDYAFGDLHITPFETSHDGTDNCGYFVRLGDMTFAAATDMGCVTERADHYMRLARALMIEANYDDHMLATGRYTEHLKARIRSATGHMDNIETARYLTQIYTPRLRHVFLCHLSEDNNTPETALATVMNALCGINVRPAPSSAGIPDGTVHITALPRFRSTELYVL